MAQVKVYNDNVHPYRERFRDYDISIPAKGHILMEAGEALLFKGTFAPIQVDADGNPVPQGYKMIRIDESFEPEVEAKGKENLCQACRYEASSVKDLSEHIKESHQDVALVDEEVEQEIEKRKRAKKAG